MNTLNLRLSAFCFVLLGMISSSLTVFGQSGNRAGKPFPTVNLSKSARGAEIETALGSQLKDVAAWYGKSEADFRKLVKREKDLKIDKRGRLHYACPGPGIAAGTSTTWGNTGKTFTAPYPDAQTFQLHSKPGASKIIYLDFNGHTTSGMYWNDTFGPDLVTPAYDMDSNPGSFSATELANIQVIWQSVVEDYASFDVDVTTQDPGVEALRKTSPEDQFYGVRVCIGGSSFDWYGASAGGVAYVGSYDWNTDSPVFVFPAQLGAGNPKFVAECAAHESGHSLGLHHSGLTDGTTYYQGQGNWAPIMGASYYREITQWSIGDYTNANNSEDQLAIINGFLPYRADVVGADIASATALSGSTITTSGLIETTGEVDVFSFTTGAGNVNLSAKAAPPSSGNLHLLFSLYDSNGATITTAGPSAADTGVSISTNLAAGIYYLAVNGVGSGSPLATGFSNYASIGQYSIAGTAVPSDNQAPTAVASNSAPLTGFAPLAVSFSSSGSSDPDGSIASYLWTFGDGTANSTLANPSHTYAEAGTFNATLVVTDNHGVASAPASVTVMVQTAPVNQAPVAVASNSAPLTGPTPLTVNFSSAGSSDSDGTIASYAWLFGDGTVSTAANPAHTYTNVGTYTATLTVTDNQGATSAPVNVTITVQPPPANQPPIAVASATPTDRYVSTAVNFSSAGTSDPDGTVASYLWTFGVGTASSTQANPTYTYTTVGTYTATLTVKDNKGLSSTPVSLIIVVKPKAVYVANLTIIKTKGSKGTFATASITVRDHTGALKANATVNGKWTGLTTSTGGVKTNSSGVAISKSATTKLPGTFTYTITGITLSGHTYDPTKNLLSTISITTP